MIHSRLARLVGTALALTSPAAAQCLDAVVTPHVPEASAGYALDLALAGDTLLVGSPGRDFVTINSGAVHHFERDAASGTWDEIGLIAGADTAATDGFGIALDLSGGRLVVGATGKDQGRGAAYVFERSGNSWIEAAKLTASDGDVGDEFGQAVAVDGDRVVVSSTYWRDDVAGLDYAGAAYVFELVGGAWIETARLTPADAEANDFFGFDVAVSGGRILASAPTKKVHLGSDGAVYVFEGAGGSWAETAKLTTQPTVPAAVLGDSLALEGDRAVLGAPGTDEACPDGVQCFSGSAFVFEYAGGAWTESAHLVVREPIPQALVGRSVDLDGDRLLLGAPGFKPDVAFGAYLFERAGAAWVEVAHLVPEDGATGSLGWSVELDGGRVAMGDHLADGLEQDEGEVLVFEHVARLGSSYCSAVPNSTGSPGAMLGYGSLDVADECLTLVAHQLPENRFGYFLTSRVQGFVANPGGSQGNLCLGGTIGRFTAQTGFTAAAGSLSIRVDVTDMPPSQGAILPGETWSFQAWYRDANPTPTSNFTDGLAVTFS